MLSSFRVLVSLLPETVASAAGANRLVRFLAVRWLAAMPGILLAKIRKDESTKDRAGQAARASACSSNARPQHSQRRRGRRSPRSALPRPLSQEGASDYNRKGSRAGAGRDVFRGVLEAVLAGQPVPPNQKPSIGCNIKWKEGAEPDYFKPVGVG